MPHVLAQASEVIDATLMTASKLREFIEAELTSAKADDLMVSLSLKATMVKISDPIIFGHVVTVFFKDAFEKLKKLLDDKRAAIEGDIAACYEVDPRIANVIIDASMPVTRATCPIGYYSGWNCQPARLPALPARTVSAHCQRHCQRAFAARAG